MSTFMQNVNNFHIPHSKTPRPKLPKRPSTVLSSLPSVRNLWGAIFQMKCLHWYKKPFYPMPRCNNESTSTRQTESKLRTTWLISDISPHALSSHLCSSSVIMPHTHVIFIYLLTQKDVFKTCDHEMKSMKYIQLPENFQNFSEKLSHL